MKAKRVPFSAVFCIVTYVTISAHPGHKFKGFVIKIFHPLDIAQILINTFGIKHSSISQGSNAEIQSGFLFITNGEQNKFCNVERSSAHYNTCYKMFVGYMLYLVVAL